MVAVNDSVAVSVTRSSEAVTGVIIFSLVLASVFILKNFFCEGFLDSGDDYRSLIVGALPFFILAILTAFWDSFGLQYFWLYLSLSAFWIMVHTLSELARFWTDEGRSVKENSGKFRLNLAFFVVSLLFGVWLLNITMHYQTVNLLKPLTDWLGVNYG